MTGRILLPHVLTFANLLSAALLAGAMFGIYLSFNPEGLDAEAYIYQQQHGIRTLNTTMPLLGLLTILLTLTGAIVFRADREVVMLMGFAVASFLAAGLVTRFLNQPINAIVIQWIPHAPPADWTVLRERWWQWHELRTILSVGGLCLVIVAALKAT